MAGRGRRSCSRGECPAEPRSAGQRRERQAVTGGRPRVADLRAAANPRAPPRTEAPQSDLTPPPSARPRRDDSWRPGSAVTEAPRRAVTSRARPVAYPPPPPRSSVPHSAPLSPQLAAQLSAGFSTHARTLPRPRRARAKGCPPRAPRVSAAAGSGHAHRRPSAGPRDPARPRNRSRRGGAGVRELLLLAEAE